LIEKNELVLSHGQMVLKDVFKAGDFIKSFNTVVGTQSYYTKNWEELEALVVAHRDDFEPGTGSVDNDVILVNVPAENFFTSIVEITENNAHLVRFEDVVRLEGEKSVKMNIIDGVKSPASFVQIVCYRADVLAQDDDRSTDAEWELIAINAQVDKVTPMHPTTMARNSNHDNGGTFREYSDEEWAAAEAYWDKHAYVNQT
jgi:hypothetical protein